MMRKLCRFNFLKFFLSLKKTEFSFVLNLFFNLYLIIWQGSENNNKTLYYAMEDKKIIYALYVKNDDYCYHI